MPKLFALALLVLTLFGCAGKDATVLDWDLATSHTLEDIGISGRQGGGFDNVESVRVQLPEGQEFQASGDVKRVSYFALHDELEQLNITFEAQTAEDAYARVQEFIDEWGLSERIQLDEWYAQARGVTGPEAAEINTSEVFAVAPGEIDDIRIGADGPFIEVVILYSFNDDRPFTVSFQLHW
ncbi:MAG: hypothetical protein ACT4OX_02020 [Actinomycetota bacterium]